MSLFPSPGLLSTLWWCSGGTWWSQPCKSMQILWPTPLAFIYILEPKHIKNLCHGLSLVRWPWRPLTLRRMATRSGSTNSDMKFLFSSSTKSSSVRIGLTWTHSNPLWKNFILTRKSDGNNNSQPDVNKCFMKKENVTICLQFIPHHVENVMTILTVLQFPHMRSWLQHLPSA